MTSQSLFLLAPICGIPRRRFPKRYPSWEVSTRIPMFCWWFSLSPQYPISYLVVTPHGSWIVPLSYRIYIYIHVYIVTVLLISIPVPISWLIHPYSPKNPSNYCWWDVSYIRALSLLWLLLDFHVFLEQWNLIVLFPQDCLPFPSY